MKVHMYSFVSAFETKKYLDGLIFHVYQSFLYLFIQQFI